jgi:transcriptional regulator with XRE-family HTH domain
VARRIAELRSELGVTQEEFAVKLRVSTNYVRLVERGRQNLTLTTLARFAKMLGVAIPDLFVPPQNLRSNPGRPPKGEGRRKLTR